MLRLDKGRAMKHVVKQLENLGFNWAYRVVDTRAFGLPHRRQRVILLASRTEDPRNVLFHASHDPYEPERTSSTPCGFYWTEGVRGIGWAVDAVPTLKGGSTVGIPSPPCIWVPDRKFLGLPEIRDAERLQGFPSGWTAPAVEDPTKRNGPRWKLVGNAVSVPVAEWVGEELANPKDFDASSYVEIKSNEKWPEAAWGYSGKRYKVQATMWPKAKKHPSILEFLNSELTPLSERATKGFLSRVKRSSLNEANNPEFQETIRTHLSAMSDHSTCC
jgi:DNA (cytosine-5)-methyltransferase 1